MGWIYKYVYQGNIVYIGKSDSSLEARIKAHEKEDKFQPYLDSEIWYFETINPNETSVFEKCLIDKYKPIINVVDKYEENIRVQIEEPVWNKYHGQSIKSQETKENTRIVKNKKEVQKPQEKRYPMYSSTMVYKIPTNRINDFLDATKGIGYGGDRLLRYILTLKGNLTEWFTFNKSEYFKISGICMGGKTYTTFKKDLMDLVNNNIIEWEDSSEAIKLSCEIQDILYN